MAPSDPRYEIRLAGRTLSLSSASTADVAVKDFLRSLGCSDGEIHRVSSGAVSWRGAVYRAVPIAAGRETA